MSKPKEAFKFGPFEQALAVVVVMGLAANPSIPYSFLSASGTLNGFPLLSPPLVMLVLIAYIGYHILARQEGARERDKALAKADTKSSSSSSSSSSSKPLSSSDVRSGGLPASSKSGNPAPKQVSGSGLDPRKDPSSNAFRKNYFLTMQGPGRPALVPFQDGLRPKAGQAEGTMWWDNVPEDATDLMAPRLEADKLKAMMKNPWAAEMLQKEVELLKLAKKQKEEEGRYEKVANMLQTLLGLLLCLVDMRLGMLAFVFFLWRHYTTAHARDMSDTKDAIETEKAELKKKISEAKKSSDSNDATLLSQLQQQLDRL
ncbi:hypothetical protein EHS25_009662 [Saitozyma podzolica]|uniref:Uncharacterized protein n=1 Tax=Saitozyma podzolica TaxID=1890683 RepID=A0A427YJV6_9TREE|nr:hypothetical protein EHS25_009662 [Saitozyma podzolica]